MLDLYLTSLGLGGVGLAAMAISGFTHGSHGAHAGHAGHAGHGGHGGHGHASSGHAASSHAVSSHGTHADHATASQTLLSLMSPRTLFSVCLGVGTAGLVLRPLVGDGVFLFIMALAAGVIFERILVTPIWNMAFRFESNPALTLESATGGEATAVSSFDANGQGLIAVEVDGQMIQLLGTLRSADREFRTRVPTGTKLRVEDVDAARNRCTVSLL